MSQHDDVEPCTAHYRAFTKGTHNREYTLHQCILPRGHAEGDRASSHKTSVAGKMMEWRFRYGTK